MPPDATTALQRNSSSVASGLLVHNMNGNSVGAIRSRILEGEQRLVLRRLLSELVGSAGVHAVGVGGNGTSNRGGVPERGLRVAVLSAFTLTEEGQDGEGSQDVDNRNLNQRSVDADRSDPLRPLWLELGLSTAPPPPGTHKR